LTVSRCFRVGQFSFAPFQWASRPRSLFFPDLIPPLVLPAFWAPNPRHSPLVLTFCLFCSPWAGFSVFKGIWAVVLGFFVATFRFFFPRCFGFSQCTRFTFLKLRLFLPTKSGPVSFTPQLWTKPFLPIFCGLPTGKYLAPWPRPFLVITVPAPGGLRPCGVLGDGPHRFFVFGLVGYFFGWTQLVEVRVGPPVFFRSCAKFLIFFFFIQAVSPGVCPTPNFFLFFRTNSPYSIGRVLSQQLVFIGSLGSLFDPIQKGRS